MRDPPETQESRVAIEAQRSLGSEEVDLSNHLSRLIFDCKMDSAALILEIVPKYWEGQAPHQENLKPTGVYRPFYYIHGYEYSGPKTRALRTRPRYSKNRSRNPTGLFGPHPKQGFAGSFSNSLSLETTGSNVRPVFQSGEW